MKYLCRAAMFVSMIGTYMLIGMFLAHSQGVLGDPSPNILTPQLDKGPPQESRPRGELPTKGNLGSCDSPWMVEHLKAITLRAPGWKLFGEVSTIENQFVVSRTDTVLKCKGISSTTNGKRVPFTYSLEIKDGEWYLETMPAAFEEIDNIFKGLRESLEPKNTGVISDSTPKKGNLGTCYSPWLVQQIKKINPDILEVDNGKIVGMELPVEGEYIDTKKLGNFPLFLTPTGTHTDTQLHCVGFGLTTHGIHSFIWDLYILDSGKWYISLDEIS
jgi:hypothetical protein